MNIACHVIKKPQNINSRKHELKVRALPLPLTKVLTPEISVNNVPTENLTIITQHVNKHLVINQIQEYSSVEMFLTQQDDTME